MKKQTFNRKKYFNYQNKLVTSNRHQFFYRRGRWLIGISAIAISGLLMFAQTQVDFLKVSILEAPSHEPFDGTVIPIQSVPNWVLSREEEREMSYLQFPAEKLIPLPNYDLVKLATVKETLVWGNPDHDKIRNLKITYPVVWAGNYKLDHTEKSGSHPGVDIKALSGTPVVAIANGIVHKASFSSSGFGNHVVIEHRDVPSFDDSSEKVTLYSGYAHLLNIAVKEGEVVRKGQKIGEIGRTGTATTNHLHFQIDTNQAPWHLYFPFTSAEAREAGLNFFEAVNAGLGLDNVEAYTLNPLKYVQKYSNYKGGDSRDSSRTNSPPANTSENSTINQNGNTKPPIENNPQTSEQPLSQPSEISTPITEAIVEPETTPITKDSNVESFQVVVLDPIALVGDSSRLSITAVDIIGRIVSNPYFLSTVPSLELTSPIGTLTKNLLEADDFTNGQVTILFKPEQQGYTQVRLAFGQKQIVSEQISAITEMRQSSKYVIDHDGNYNPSIPESITIKALDDQGLPAPKVFFIGKLEISVPNPQGTSFSKSEFVAEDFSNAMVKLEFSSNTATNYVFFLTLNGQRIFESSTLVSSTVTTTFSDVKANHPKYQTIQYLYEKNIITGYPDGTFKPDQAVSRVEALKFIYQISNNTLNDLSTLPFSDVASNQWYSKYVATAYTDGIVDGYPDKTFKPEQQVIRAELLKMLFNALKIDVPPVSTQLM